MGLQKIKPFFSASCLLDSSISTMIIFTPLAFKILEAIFPINPNPKIIIFSSNCILSFLIPFNAIDPKIEKLHFYHLHLQEPAHKDYVQLLHILNEIHLKLLCRLF